MLLAAALCYLILGFIANDVDGFALAPNAARSGLALRLQGKLKQSSLMPFKFSSPALHMAKDASDGDGKEGVEPKYLIALVVFLLACVYDKMVMHGGF